MVTCSAIVTYYTLILENFQRNQLDSLKITINNDIASVETLLLENFHYTYRILSYNMLGESELAEIEIGK